MNIPDQQPAPSNAVLEEIPEALFQDFAESSFLRIFNQELEGPSSNIPNIELLFGIQNVGTTMEPPKSELFGNLKLSPQLHARMNVSNTCVSNSPLGNDVYGGYLLNCSHSECHGKRSFTNKQALKKHMERHTRPYPCTVSRCTVNSFGTKGDLQRHHRQVHERHQFRCPDHSCDRHNQGFGRKDNLREHLRRMHPLRDNGSDALEMDGGAIKDASPASAPEIIPDVRSDQPHTFRPPLKAELEAELVKLEATKSETERDIEALKRVLQMM